MRDFKLYNGVLTYYKMTSYPNHSKKHFHWKRVGCDMRKPEWWLWLKGLVWKWLGL